jgi:hypothetical protein
MVLVMARHEDGPCERRPKMLKGKLRTSLGTKGPSQKTGIEAAKKRFNLLFLTVRRRSRDIVADDEDDDDVV